MSKRKPFIHLHGHSKYSPRDAYNDFVEILQKSMENEQPAIAVTDHYYMYNISEFYFNSIDKHKDTGEPLVVGVKPIIGCELGVAPEFETENNIEADYFHLTALAMSEVGKQNLMRMASISTNKDGEHFYRNPRVLWEDFKKYNEGIIILSGCLGSEVNELITAGKKSVAKKVMQRYLDLFGDRYYVEIQDHGIKQQAKNNKVLIELARELDIPLVLTNDYHYTEKDYAHSHGVLVYGCQGKHYKGVWHKETEYYHEDEYYIKTDDEMWEIAQKWDIEDAYNNTYAIYERIEDVIFDTEKIKFPKAQLEKFDNADDELRDLAYSLLENKYPNPDNPVALSAWDGEGVVPSHLLSQETPRERLERELLDIAEAGYSDYFLIVFDILKYAHDNEIMVGDGRGSAGGSILSNILGITNLCPLKYSLYFERFFNKGRVDSPPDIDIDFRPSRREEIFGYVVDKYGAEYVAQIGTFGKIGGRSALNIAAKANGDPKKGAYLGGLLDRKNEDLFWNYQNNKRVINECNKSKLVDTIFSDAIDICGCINNRSTHAAGVIISDEPINNYIPTVYNDGASGRTTQIEYPICERQRLLKVDLLGLETLDVLQNTIWHVEETRNEKIVVSEIPLNDQKTFDIFRSGDTKGVFQLEADWCNDMIKQSNVNHFDNISALVALIRPGSMNSGMTATYLKRAQGLEDSVPIHPNVAYSTEETYHCLLYQEQIMETAKALAGYDLLKADAVRKAVSKSKKEVLMKMRDEFVEGCKKHSKIPAKEANIVFDAIEKFGDYGFNKAHSVGYAKNAYITAYLKANYFIEFMSALLTSVVGDFDKQTVYLNNVLEHGYDILSPDINISTDEFYPDVENNGIRFPLNAIDGVGPSAATCIIEERELNGPYKSFEDFVFRTPGKTVNKATVIALIVVGAFDSFGVTRKDIFDDCENYIAEVRGKAKTAKAKGLGLSMGGEKLELVKKTNKEFPYDEVIQDEINYIGFAFSLSEKDKKKRLKEIKANSKVDYENMSNPPKLKADNPKSNKGSDTKKSGPSALERLKKAKEAKESESALSEDEKKEVSSIRDKLKGDIGKKPKKEKVVENTNKNIESYDKHIVVTIGADENISFAKILRVSRKYTSDTEGSPLTFDVITADESNYILETETQITDEKRFIKLLHKIVGEENVAYKECDWR